MFVLIPGSITPVRFGPAVKDPAEISIPAVTYIRMICMYDYVYVRMMQSNWNHLTILIK